MSREKVNPFIDFSPFIDQNAECKLLSNNELPNIRENKYYASSDGNIYTIYPNNRIIKMKPYISNRGYEVLRFVTSENCDKSTIKSSVHRLILKAFKGAPENDTMQCNHINGKKLDNNISNLEWTTPQENTVHSFKTNLHKRKMDKETVLGIAEELVNNMDITYKELAEKFNVSLEDVRSIRRGFYRDITKDYIFPKNRSHRIPADIVNKIADDIENTDLYYKDIAAKYGVTKDVVRDISRGSYREYLKDKRIVKSRRVKYKNAIHE